MVTRTLRDALLPMLDRGLRPIGGLLGLRPWQVFVRVTTWSGERPGTGTKAVTQTQLTVGKPPQPVKVVEVSERDVVASGGLYRASDLRVGPITPTYTSPSGDGGGYVYSVIDPAAAATGAEIEWVLKSTVGGRSTNGDLYEKVAEEAARRGGLDFYVVLRSTGQAA